MNNPIKLIIQRFRPAPSVANIMAGFEETAVKLEEHAASSEYTRVSLEAQLASVIVERNDAKRIASKLRDLLE